MLEIAGGIILAVIIIALFPVFLTIALYLIPPVLGVIIGGFIGVMVGGEGGVLAGALIGLISGISVDIALTRE